MSKALELAEMLDDDKYCTVMEITAELRRQHAEIERLREAARMGLEALNVATTPLAKDRQEVLRAIAALKEALGENQSKSHSNNKVNLGEKQ